MITVVSGAARRPHVPRSKELRILFNAIGIDTSRAKDDGALSALSFFKNKHGPPLRRDCLLPGAEDEDFAEEGAEACETEGEFEEDHPVELTAPRSMLHEEPCQPTNRGNYGASKAIYVPYLTG